MYRRQGQVSEERKRLEIENISFLVPRTEIHDFGFAGARFDSETGLYYHEARYRLPEMQSKFLSPDPLGFLITGNHYAYAENNPVSLYDPDGRIFNFALAAIGAGVGAVIGAASYGAKVIFTDEEFDWRDFAVHTGTGFVAGGLAGFTGGASLALTAQMGATATTGSMIAGGAAGFVGGGINSGAIKGYET
jgi:RHS repeat-associated protein